MTAKPTKVFSVTKVNSRTHKRFKKTLNYSAKVKREIILRYLAVVKQQLLAGYEWDMPRDLMILCVVRRELTNKDKLSFMKKKSFDKEKYNFNDLNNVYCIRGNSKFLEEQQYRFKSDKKLREAMISNIGTANNYRHVYA